MSSLVSIVMPLYNCESFIEESVRSVELQIYSNWELIIVDDKSTDNSYILAEDIAKSNPKIQLHQLESNGGVSAARNYAIKLAKGKYIAFLDSDDLWLPNKLEQQVDYMHSNKSLLSFTAYQRISDTGIISNNIVSVPKNIAYEELLKKNVIGCLTAMYDRFQIGKFYFDTSLKKQEDYQYWLEILKHIPYADGLNSPLAYYRMGHNSLSSNKLVAAGYVWKILRQYQNIPLFKALYYFGCYTTKSLFKYYGK